MATPLLDRWANVKTPVIGMLHLPALPGAPGYRGDLAAISAAMLRDAEALQRGGVDGLMIENFGDTPFYPDRVPAATVAHLTAIAASIRRAVDLPLGINMLRNDGRSALAVAHAVGAAYIRVNVLCGARVTDQGVIQGIAHDLLRERAALGAGHIRILADVNVKHSAPLGPGRAIDVEVHDMVERAGADAVIVSGSGTGQAADLDQLRAAKAAAGTFPVLVGSGITAETVGEYRRHADGFIVGTSVKVGGQTTAAVDVERVRRLMAAVRG